MDYNHYKIFDGTLSTHLHCTTNCLCTTPLTYVKGVKGHHDLTIPLITFDANQRPFLI